MFDSGAIEGGRMRRTAGIAAIASLSWFPGAGLTYAQQAAPAELLFRMALENTTRALVTTEVLANPGYALHPYGDGRNILVAIGKNETDPHLFDGLCEKPCGLTFQDKNNYFNLTGKAKIKWTTIVSGFHQVRPLIKLADGTLLVGNQADGSVADWQQSEVSISEVRWLKLDPDRGVTLGQWVEKPDLSRIDEVGFFDVIPGSGVHIDGVPVEKLRAPPPGGWVAIAAFELWGKPVKR
jgi:hypothetical protein